MKKRYDNDYNPPAPTVVVAVANSAGKHVEAVEVPMKLDSGADMSCLPYWVVKKAGSRRYTDDWYARDAAIFFIAIPPWEWR